MADPPLHNSWPSFSWMRRWSFKRASDCKPCVPVSAPSSSTSLSPASIPEDVFFSSSPEDKRSCLAESDAEFSSEDDILDLCSSLRDSEYFRDLQLGSSDPSDPRLPGLNSPVSGKLSSTPLEEEEPERESNLVAEHSLIFSGGDAMDRVFAIRSSERKDHATSEEDERLHMEHLPTLVRSMSTSRRHSWEVPVSPIDLGRRFSLDTNGTDSDGEQDVQCLARSSNLPSSSFSESSVEESNGAAEHDGFKTPEPPTAGRTVYSRSEILATDEKSQADRVSRILGTSKQAAREAGEEQESEEELQSVEGQSHVLMVQKVLQELRQYHGAKLRSFSSDRKEVTEDVTWYEFLSRENGEEERAERPERSTKVKRTLSSLKNRVTGSFNKDKGKARERERSRGQKEQEKLRRRSVSGHQLVSGSFSSRATCSLCSKSLQRKHGLQCLNCGVNVHKSCKSLLPECSGKAKTREFTQKTPSSAAQSCSPALRDAHAPPDGWSHAPRCASGMTITPKRPSVQPSSSTLGHNSSSGSIAGEMDEVDALRLKRSAEDAVSLASTVPESLIVEDAHYAGVRGELESMAQDLEVESWSLAVDQHYLKQHSKEMIKRQDVIYELIQTEMHHVRTLKTMLRVYVRELREALQMEERRLDCLFPRLESLLELHTHFLSRLRERRAQSLQPGSHCNYTIHTLSDVLISQFSGELGERVKESYGDFCSRHNEAVNYYKEQMQNNKKFQNLMRKLSNLSIVRRLGIPECILLVTQRITKYPVLLERILHNTEGGSEEHEGLAQALCLVKDVIVQVDGQVSVYEKDARLREISSRLEPKSLGKIKDGRVFRKEDLSQGRRKLLYEGTVNWKAASGRLKDIAALLLTDVLVLLQEKDQRFVFSAVDNKPSVISLQNLIVREVAHEERAMFLICASSSEPEMYEIHTASKEERNAWIAHIRQAVESCPHTEERLFSEEEEARVAQIREFHDRLTLKDAQIAQDLTEKLQLFAELAKSVAGLEESNPRSRLLLRGDASDLQQGEQLLKGAITEVENLQNLLVSGGRGASPQVESHQTPGLMLPRRADTFGGYDSVSAILPKNGSVKKKVCGSSSISSISSRSRERSQRASSDPQLKEVHVCQDQEETESVSLSDCPRIPVPEAELYERVLLLSQKLYSLQAVISQQDSHLELQRASLLSSDRDRPGSRNRGGDVLLEQEKQRNLEKHREELLDFQRLQAQHRAEQSRWERERERQRRQAEGAELRLREREEACLRLERRLWEEQQELERQRQTYQQDLERLRESTRAVEKERLEQQRKLKKHHALAHATQLSLSSSFNGELLASGPADHTPSQKSQLRASLSASPVDYPSSSSAPPAKSEVPIHLISTTNQHHKQGSVQQQIPTKLAALSKGRSGKGKASHRTESLASVDMKQMLPVKLSLKDHDGGHKGRRPISPHQSDTPGPPDGQSALRAPAPPTNTPSEESSKEDVIFF